MVVRTTSDGSVWYSEEEVLRLRESVIRNIRTNLYHQLGEMDQMIRMEGTDSVKSMWRRTKQELSDVLEISGESFNIGIRDNPMRRNIHFEDDDIDTEEVEELLEEAHENLDSIDEMVANEDFSSAAAESELLQSTAEKLVKLMYELDELANPD